MSVSRPRAYAAYAPAPLAPRSAPAPLRPAPGSGRLRARVAVRLRLLVRFGQGPHHVGSLVVQPLQAARLAPGESVRGEHRKADRVIEGADHRVRRLVAAHLAPTHRLRGRGSREA